MKTFNIHFLFLNIVFFLNTFIQYSSYKQIIAHNIISSDLKLSFFEIPSDLDYSIMMWFRILEDN